MLKYFFVCVSLLPFYGKTFAEDNTLEKLHCISTGQSNKNEKWFLID